MTRAIVVIDVQESFRQRPNWSLISNPEVVKQVDRLVEVGRAQGDLIVWVLHSEPGSDTVFDPANGHVHLVDELSRQADELLITKSSHNAFTTTNLQQILTEKGIREVVVGGLLTEQCCETTARVAGDLGYDVSFVTEATATFPIPHRDAPAGRSLAEIVADPLTLTAEQIITRTEYVLAGRFATIRTIADLA